MTFPAATLIAAVSGYLAGRTVSSITGRGVHRSQVPLHGLLGAGLATMTLWVFGVFDVLAFVSGAQRSSSLALLLTLVLEGVVIVVAWCSMRLNLAPPLPGSIDEFLDSRPAGGRGKMWLIGGGLPVLPIHYGLECAASAKAMVGTTMWHTEVHGLPAIAYGIGLIAVGTCIHFHYFWGLHPTLWPHARTGKLVSVVAASLGLTIAFWGAMLERSRI